jgi:hypothetical protein
VPPMMQTGTPRPEICLRDPRFSSVGPAAVLTLEPATSQGVRTDEPSVPEESLVGTASGP